jgi:hypothetical protein
LAAAHTGEPVPRARQAANNLASTARISQAPTPRGPFLVPTPPRRARPEESPEGEKEQLLAWRGEVAPVVPSSEQSMQLRRCNSGCREEMAMTRTFLRWVQVLAFGTPLFVGGLGLAQGGASGGTAGGATQGGVGRGTPGGAAGGSLGGGGALGGGTGTAPVNPGPSPHQQGAAPNANPSGSYLTPPGARSGSSKGSLGPGSTGTSTGSVGGMGGASGGGSSETPGVVPSNPQAPPTR